MTTAITCTDRTGNIEFAFDEKMNMESITVNADYSLGEILTKAGLNTGNGNCVYSIDFHFIYYFTL